MEPPSPYVTMVTGSSITGVVKLEGRIVLILDLEKIVADLNPDLSLHIDEAALPEFTDSYRALVADDSSLVREMLKSLLEKAKFVVDIVNNGKEAWDRLERIKAKAAEDGRPVTDYLQVLISDIEMPFMDGHNLTKRVKDDPALHNLPVILFSSIITEKLRHKGQSVGADDQISKPEVTQLARRAMDLIKARQEAVTA